MPIYGKPATGLSGDTSWAKNEAVVRIGAAGEVKTAELLNVFAGKATVMHDLRVPGSRGNIDHAFLAGNQILLIDTKVWRPGFLWTRGGVTRRGWAGKAPECDKDFVKKARDRIDALLPEASVVMPMVVVWPSNKRNKLSLWAARMPGATLVTPERLRATVRRMARKGEARPENVAALKKLLVK